MSVLHCHHVIAYNATRQRWVRHRAAVLVSPTEQELLIALASGLQTSEVAQRMHRSIKTVEAHILRLCQRLGLAGRQELTIAAEQLYGGCAEVEPLDVSMLSDRELELIGLIATGAGYPVIAQTLGIQAKSVWPRVDKIKQKCGVDSLAMLRAAARKAIEGSL